MTVLETSVRDAVWAALDFESSGASPGQPDEPVQVGMAVWNPKAGAPGNFFRSYVRSSAPIAPAAEKVHRISDGDIANAPTMSALWPEFKKRLTGAVVVAHGAGTEKRFLRVFPFHGFGPWVDTLSISRAVLPDLSEHSLGGVIAALKLEDEVRGLCPELGWHDALFDAAACLVLLRHLVNRLDLGGLTVGQMRGLDAAAYHRRRALRRSADEAGWQN